MTHERWYWAAIWRGNILRRGWSTTADGCAAATEGSLVCTYAQDQDQISERIPELLRRVARQQGMKLYEHMEDAGLRSGHG